MRQRNDTGTTWTFAATPASADTPEQPPYAVGPGEPADHPNLLDGWTAVDDDAEPDHAKAADEPQPKPAARKRGTEESKEVEPK